MQSLMSSQKKILISVSVLISLVVLVILFISPITKYVVQKYDVKYLGREITLGWAYVNPFTGYVHLSNLKVFEMESDSLFFSAEGVNANFEMLKLFAKTYEISQITLNHPRGIIIQNKSELNFNDLIELFSSKKKSTSGKKRVHFNILKIKINDGEFHYREEQIPVNYFIKNVNIESIGKQWDSDTIVAKFSFASGTSVGDMKGDITINFKNLDYRFAVLVNKFDLDIIQQYLKDLSNYGSFRASLDADLKAKGNFRERENLTASGVATFNEFHFGKSPEDDYASFDKLVLAVTELSPENHKYLFDSISLSHPFFKYERYDYLDNIQSVFGKKGANIKTAAADETQFNLVIEIARYIKVLAKNFIKSDYKIGRVAIYNSDIQFNDFSTTEKFAVELEPLTIVADSIDKEHDRVEISLKSEIKPYGNLSVALSINPNDSSDFDLNYHFQKLPVSLFNPYIISYTSYPLDRGTLEFKGTWNVKNGKIKSENHVILIDPRVTKRIKNKDTKWIPVPLIMAFVRENGNVIDYEIPITGDLKNPKFHAGDAILDLLENVFVKPITTPYRIQVKSIEGEIEKSLSLKWAMRNSLLLPAQEKFIEKMADYLVENPEASVSIDPQQYEQKEKEYILFFEAKKKYFLLRNNKTNQSFNEVDANAVDKMSVKDTVFVTYLNKLLNDSMLFTIQQKCALFIDSSIVDRRFQSLAKERENAFMLFFNTAGVQHQVKISPGKNLIPYNGFSFYKINYKGEFPEALTKAYLQMNELNDETPRKKFKQERSKNGNTL